MDICVAAFSRAQADSNGSALGNVRTVLISCLAHILLFHCMFPVICMWLFWFVWFYLSQLSLILVVMRLSLVYTCGLKWKFVFRELGSLPLLPVSYPGKNLPLL